METIYATFSTVFTYMYVPFTLSYILFSHHRKKKMQTVVWPTVVCIDYHMEGEFCIWPTACTAMNVTTCNTCTSYNQYMYVLSCGWSSPSLPFLCTADFSASMMIDFILWQACSICDRARENRPLRYNFRFRDIGTKFKHAIHSMQR